MNKKLISVLASVALMIPSAAFAENETNILSLLNSLKIMQGDGNGNYRLDDYVSRAEFAKIAVAASSAKDMVASGLKISPFKDVKYTDWFAPYVQAAVSAGLCKGYIDGTFKPNDTVSYEEAITMLLRNLGYSEDDFGVSWPYGQVGMAQNLDITDGVDSGIGRELTRRQVAALVYNTLNTKQKGGTGKLISIFDCTVTEDVTIVASHNEDSTLKTDEIYTTSGKFDIDGNFDYGWVGKKGDIFVKNGNKLVTFMPDDSATNTALDKYVIYSMLQNAVVCYKDGAFKQIDINDTVTCYKNTSPSTYGAVKNEMEMGDILYVKMNGDTVDYVSYEKGSMEGPVKVISSGWMSRFQTNSSTQIMRNGVKTAADSILTNDILYFSKDLNMILAYTDKITGIYEAAYPTKDAPTSVKISGKEYKIESVEAFNALSSSGSVKIGDTVTVLLGRGGEIAGVVGSNESISDSAVGYVTETGTKNYTNDLGQGYSSYYVKMTGTDGTESEYKVKSDADAYLGKACSVTFKDGTASLSVMKSGSGASGTVSSASFTIGSVRVSENARILDTVLSKTYSSSSCKRIYLQRLDGLNLSSSKVLYCGKNASGEITDLILDNVTGDAYSYGIVSGKTSSSSKDGNVMSESYTLDLGGTTMSYNIVRKIAKASPIYALVNGNKVEQIWELKAYSNAVSSLTNTYAAIVNSKYKLSDGVLVYKTDGLSGVTRMALDDAVNGSYKLTAYYDKPESEGGRIRVIIAR